MKLLPTHLALAAFALGFGLSVQAHAKAEFRERINEVWTREQEVL